MIARLVLVLAAIAACGDDTTNAPAPLPPVAVHVTVANARDRIFEAEKRLADSFRIDGADDVVARLAFLQNVAAPQTAAGSGDTPPDLDVWRFEHGLQRVKDLEQRLQEYLLRGSTDAYRASATIDVELQLLRDLAARAGLPTDAVPDEPLLLLRRDQLAVLDRAWKDAADALELAEARIGLPSEAQLTARETISEQRRRIADAHAQPEAALRARLVLAPRRAAAEEAAWVSHLEASREHLIDARERELLQRALARDGSDIPAMRRAAELDHEPRTVSGQVRAAAMNGAREFLLRSAVSTKLRDRLHDPVRAAWRDAMLQLQYEHDLRPSTGPAKQDEQPSRLTWELSFLDDGDLAERMEWLHHVLNSVERLDARVSPAFQRHVDRDHLRIEYAAMKKEIARRQAGGARVSAEPDGPTVVLLLSEPPTKAEGLGPEILRAFWESLRRLDARGYSQPVVQSLLTDLSIEGFRNEAEWVADRLQDVILANDEKGRVDLQTHADLIRNGLDDLVKKGVADERIESIREVLPTHIPRVSNAPLRGLLQRERRVPLPFGDERLRRTRASVDASVSSIRQVRALEEWRARHDAEVKKVPSIEDRLGTSTNHEDFERMMRERERARERIHEGPRIP